MSAFKPSYNLAARMGRWSARHWKTATFGWLALVLVAFALGSMVGTKNVDESKSGPGQSGRMDRILDAGFKQPAAESVLIQSRTLRADSPAFQAAVRDVVTRVSHVPVVQHVRSGDVSKDRRSALVQFEIRGEKSKAADKIGPVLDAVAAAQDAHPGLFIGEFGDASSVKALDKTFADDFAKAGVFSIPLTLLILVLAFGALVAAGIPLLLALTAVFATFGLVAIPSHVLPIAKEANAVVLLIGLAVGVDYSMFYLRRAREERAAGRSDRAAIEAAAATSGRSVLISGLTVMVAMAGMFFTGNASFASIGLATMIVVAVAMVGSLTVLPALLSRLGDKVDRLRVPLVGRLRRNGGEGRVWGAIVDRVLRRPLLSAAVSAGLLLALAVPALQLRMATPGPDTFPKSLDVVKAYDRMQQAFPGTALPAHVVVKGSNVNAPAVREAIRTLERQAIASGRMYEPITVEVNKDATVANITVPIAGTGTDAASGAAVRDLRKTIVPETVGALPGAQTGVTGITAEWKDGQDQMKSNLPYVVGFVLLLAFVLMLTAFRSIVVAIKAIVLNLLSVGAAYGVLVLVFQDGFGKGFLGFSSTAGISPEIPMLLFVILFGLSMDYHVLIVSRIREAFDRGAKMDEAIATGIRSTAGVVTSAAIVMVAVFSVFITLSLLMFKQAGVGLAVAILIDATIVRGVLLPATMKLLGEWNWYLPRWLEWLPRVAAYEPTPEPEPEARPAPSRPPVRKRVLTPGRIVSLVLIGLAVLSLGYLRLGTGSAAVSVPAGAKAGDLALESCSYGTEKGDYAADCGTLAVRENRHDPRSRLIALPVKRIHARSARAGAPIFRLQGGPGITNMQFAEASRIAQNHDVVLVGYRGVDGSVRLDCPEVESALKSSSDFLAEKSFAAEGRAFRSCATRLADDGVDLARYTMPEQADDLEAARKALGYGKIDLLSESAGTRLAMIYAWRYPSSVRRSVMIGANPPGNFLWYGRTTDEQIRRYAALCAKDTHCGKRTGDLAATVRRVTADLPDHWWFLPIKKGNVRVASFFGLMEATSAAAPLSAPQTLDNLISADKGDASGLWALSVLAQLEFPSAFVWGEAAAVGRLDADAARRYYANPDRRTIMGNPGTDLIWAGGRLVDAWPATPDENEYDRMRTSTVPTLLVGGALDGATPPQNATRELLPYLPNGRQVVLENLGHTTDFWNDEPKASSRLLNAFFDSGRADTSLYSTKPVDFASGFPQTSIAKILLIVLLSGAGLAALSLLWLPWRSRRRGGFGRKTSAALRSVYPFVLGVGGWLTGVIVVLVALPTVPLDDALLGAASVGIPVGLGIYWAWTRREHSSRTKTAGLAAALGGALVGAWLGQHTVEGLIGLVAAVMGATAGSNLLVLALDIAHDRAVQALAATRYERLSPSGQSGQA